MTRATYARLLGVMVLITIVTSIVMVNIDWNGDAASVERGPIDTLLDVMIALSAFVFAIVIVMLGYAVWKYRAKPGDESDGEPIHGNTRLEIAWTVIPTVIVLFGAVYSWIVLDDLEARADDRMPLSVTAQQYAWSFEYPEHEVDGEPLATKELHVPVDRQLEVKLTALDVLHSFWVPEWGIKRDAVPTGTGGDEVDDEFVVTPNEEGAYSLVCTELCGIGHSTMRASVVVESQEDFDAWIDEQIEAGSGGGATPTGDAGSSSGSGS